MKLKKQIIFSILKIIIGITALALCIFVGIVIYQLISDKEAFETWLSGYGNMSRLIYIAIVALQVLLAIIPGEPLEIAGGYIFGALEGTILNLIGATIGSISVFFLVRRFGKALVAQIFPKEKLEKLRFLQSSKKRDILLMLIFMMPGTPKDLLCYFAGLTGIKYSVWLIICSIGRLPSIITSTIGGGALENKQYTLAIVTFIAAAAISLGGILLYHMICKKNETKS